MAAHLSVKVATHAAVEELAARVGLLEAHLSRMARSTKEAVSAASSLGAEVAVVRDRVDDLSGAVARSRAEVAALRGALLSADEIPAAPPPAAKKVRRGAETPKPVLPDLETGSNFDPAVIIFKLESTVGSGGVAPSIFDAAPAKEPEPTPAPAKEPEPTPAPAKEPEPTPAPAKEPEPTPAPLVSVAGLGAALVNTEPEPDTGLEAALVPSGGPGAPPPKELEVASSKVPGTVPLPGAAPTNEPETAPVPLTGAIPAKEPEAVPAKEPEAVPASLTGAIPAKEPETVPAKEPETVPAKEPETVPAKEPEAIPAKEPETVPAKEPEAIPDEKSSPKKESRLRAILRRFPSMRAVAFQTGWPVTDDDAGVVCVPKDGAYVIKWSANDLPLAVNLRLIHLKKNDSATIAKLDTPKNTIRWNLTKGDHLWLSGETRSSNPTSFGTLSIGPL